MTKTGVVILISANAEWQATKQLLAPRRIHSTSLGENFKWDSCSSSGRAIVKFPVTFFHGGWGKISAATTAQYAIDHFHPGLLINLGTCGGFEGHIDRETILLVTKTIIYDIIEQMTDPEEAIEHYSTDIDLSWIIGGNILNGNLFPSSIIRGPLVSADRDILAADIPMLIQKYGAVAADWESGAIAWVAKKNCVHCLILRGVSDLVGVEGGEAYGNIGLFHEKTKNVMEKLLALLPGLLERVELDN
jgi:adenosylhomocysteine nucleosidase